jgi:hypothetical protein
LDKVAKKADRQAAKEERQAEAERRKADRKVPAKKSEAAAQIH